MRRLAKLKKLLPSRSFCHGLRHGVAAAIEHYGLLKNMPLSTLIDVGANVGQFSLLVRTLYPDMVRMEQVDVRRLDEVLNPNDIVRPALLKLDVQGYELAALLGCGRVLDAVNYVYTVVSFISLYSGQALADDIVQFLFAHDFSFAAVNNPAFDRTGRCVQADLLFRRRSMPK